MGLLSESAATHAEGDYLFVHGSPRNPLYEYIFPEDIYNKKKLEQVFASVTKHCFHGHTHLPGVMLEGGQFLNPEELGGAFKFDDRKAMVNVGSVGQPRGGDSRACYAVIDDDAVFFRQVVYDVETTIKKIRDIDDLDDFNGDRLGDGR